MFEAFAQLFESLRTDYVVAVVQAAVLVTAGVLLGRVASRTTARVLDGKLDAHRTQLASRGVLYAIVVMFGVSALRELGFQLSFVLGAAGVLSVAVGFASQTSAANFVSGLFLIGERPFSVGDVIRIGDTTGEVLSIDLLSVKLRTFDNLYVRIPNETVVKSEVTNFARFPIRRADLLVGVAYKEDLRRVQEVLLDVADRNPLSLEEPKPLLIMRGFGESSIDIQFSVWSRRENFLDMRNSMQLEIKEALDRAGIEIPFPHRTLYTGAATDPMPVRIVAED